MKIKDLLITLTLLPAVCAGAGAREFNLVSLTADDLRFSSEQDVPAPAAPQSDLSSLGEIEIEQYLADTEPDAGGYEKTLPDEPAAVNLGGDGAVTLYHSWNMERLEVRYRDQEGNYIPEAMAEIKHLFRCRLTGLEMDVPVKLVELLDIIQEKRGGKTIIVTCGYRSPKLNGALSHHSSGVAKRSLHMKGWAADIRIEGVKTSALRDTAKSIKAGGVGYYPSQRFVHVDIGEVRYW